MKNNLTKILQLILLSLVFVGCAEEEVKTKKAVKQTKQYSSFFFPANPEIKIAKHQVVYLPVYSHVYTSEEKYEPMGITVSVRNTDANNNLLVTNISYFNTGGDLLESYISKPHILKPMASIDFIVPLKDMRGGSGANFIIEWGGDQELSNPIIQAVMVNNSGNRAFSFITDGYPVQ